MNMYSSSIKRGSSSLWIAYFFALKSSVGSMLQALDWAEVMYLGSQCTVRDALGLIRELFARRTTFINGIKRREAFPRHLPACFQSTSVAT